VPGSVTPRRGGSFEEGVLDLSFGPSHRGMATLGQSVANGVTASEKLPEFIVDIERLDLTTTLPGCRANFAVTADLPADVELQPRRRFSGFFATKRTAT